MRRQGAEIGAEGADPDAKAATPVVIAPEVSWVCGAAIVSQVGLRRRACVISLCPLLMECVYRRTQGKGHCSVWHRSLAAYAEFQEQSWLKEH